MFDSAEIGVHLEVLVELHAAPLQALSRQKLQAKDCTDEAEKLAI